MKTFVDNAGRTWSVTINVWSLKRIKSMCHVDLNTILDDNAKLLVQLHADPCLLGDVLYAVCVPEAQERNVSEESFQTALGGDCLAQGREALTAEWADFIQDPRGRKVVADLLGKFAACADALANWAAKEAEPLSREMEAAAAELNSPAPSPGDSSTKPPESAESIPVPSPSLS